MKLESKQLKAFGLPDDLIARAQAAGVPFGLLFQLVMQFGKNALTIVQQIIDAWENPTPPAVVTKRKAAKAGCCDHEACCEAVVESALNTLDLAYAHLAECCSAE